MAHAPKGPSSAMQRKLKKAIEPQADSPETLDALRELSTFYVDNSVPARRGLQSSVEERGLVINRRLLAAFEQPASASGVASRSARSVVWSAGQTAP